jgi:predicted DCC family thiol-disulfide oxidoreductase YuxK
MERAIVIYDADCGFCRWSLAILLTLDRPRAVRDRTPAVPPTADGPSVDCSRSEHGRPCPPIQRVGWARSAAIGALRALPLGTEEADRLLADLPVEERAASWHLVVDKSQALNMAGAARPIGDVPGAVRLSAGAALAPALALLPGGRIPAALLGRLPRLTEHGYRWVADHRGRLGRLVPARARRWADRVIAAHGQVGP